MSKKDIPEQEVALYDAIGRAIANMHAALAEVDAASDCRKGSASEKAPLRRSLKGGLTIDAGPQSSQHLESYSPLNRHRSRISKFVKRSNARAYFTPYSPAH
jgi:hypothetical protein